MITLTLGGDTITVRSPALGNKAVTRRNRIKKESRGGTRIVYAHPQWPKETEFDFSFDTLTVVEANDLRGFIARTLGKQVTLLDYENKTYVGIIISPDIEIAQDGRTCDYSANFKFLVIP